MSRHRRNEQSQEQVVERKSDVEVLREARKHAAATIAIGDETNVALARQGETIERMDVKLDKMEAELSLSDKILKSMTGWTGLVTGLFGSTPKAAKSSPQPTPVAAPAVNRPTRRVVPESTPPPAPAQAEARDELDAELDGLEADLAAIKNIALDQKKTIRQPERSPRPTGRKNQPSSWSHGAHAQQNRTCYLTIWLHCCAGTFVHLF